MWWSVYSKKPGEEFHHAGVELALVRRTASAHSCTSGSWRDSSASGGDDAEFLLAGEHLLPVGVPAVVELARVLVGPFLGHLVRRVVGAGGEVQEERFVGRDLFQIRDELDRLVRQIGGEVVALLRRLRRLDLVVVEDQVRVVLVGVAAEEPVVAVEARGRVASGRTVPPR